MKKVISLWYHQELKIWIIWKSQSNFFKFCHHDIVPLISYMYNKLSFLSKTTSVPYFTRGEALLLLCDYNNARLSTSLAPVKPLRLKATIILHQGFSSSFCRLVFKQLFILLISPSGYKLPQLEVHPKPLTNLYKPRA